MRYWMNHFHLFALDLPTALHFTADLNLSFTPNPALGFRPTYYPTVEPALGL